MTAHEGSDLAWGRWEESLVSGSLSRSAALEASVPPPLIYGARDTSQVGPLYRGMKRALDIFASALGLFLLLPFLTLVALLVKITSRGPIFFRQTRIGCNGIPFSFYKFRSMMVGSENRKEQLLDRNQAEFPLFKMRNDPRVTPFGRIIRRCGVDELPQLWNVLKGDMTLVGPRPHLPEEVREYRPWHWTRLEVTPGITCLWQVKASKKLSFNQWIESDLEYVSRQSFWLDLSILAKTIVVLVSSDRVS